MKQEIPQELHLTSDRTSNQFALLQHQTNGTLAITPELLRNITDIELSMELIQLVSP
jgi:hypothetical protein